MADKDIMIESEPRDIKPYKVGNRTWSTFEINNLRKKISEGFDRLESIWAPDGSIKNNGESRSQAFVRDAGEKLVEEVVELGTPITDTNTNADGDKETPRISSDPHS